MAVDSQSLDKTLTKGLRIVELLASSDMPRGVTSLAGELGLTKSNVHRLLATLTAIGYVQSDSAGHYQLTSRIWELGVMVRSKMKLAQLASAHMTQLATETGESVHLSILDGTEVVYLDKVESPQPIAAYTRIGGRAPAWCVATGKAILAYRSPPPVLKGTMLKPFTESTITSMVALDAEFEKVRKRGYAINRGEWREEVFGIAAPIWDATNEVVGALGISGPAARFGARQTDRLSGAVVAAASRVSGGLGHRK